MTLGRNNYVFITMCFLDSRCCADSHTTGITNQNTDIAEHIPYASYCRHHNKKSA